MGDSSKFQQELLYVNQITPTGLGCPQHRYFLHLPYYVANKSIQVLSRSPCSGCLTTELSFSVAYKYLLFGYVQNATLPC